MSDTAVPDPAAARHRWLRRAAIAVGAFAAIVVLAWLVVPPVARSQLESRLTEALGRKTTVDAVAFNPFLLRVTVRRLAIADSAGPAPLLAIDELVADLSSASIWHRAPVLDSLKLVRPSLSLSRDRDGRYNVQDLIDAALAAPEGPTFGFSLNNIEVDAGAIAFDDGVAGRKHLLDALDVGLPFLSSLPYQADIRVNPRLGGAFNGTRFALGGSAVPFADRPEAALDVDVDALPLKEYVAYLPAMARVDLAGGALTTRLKVVFVDGKAGERRLEVRGEARIDGFEVKRRDASSLVAAERIALVLDRIDVFGRDVRVASIAVDAPAVDVRRLRDGTLELAQPLFAPAPRAAAPPATDARPAAAPGKPWSVTVAKATVARGAVALADETSGFRTALADVAVDASNLSTKSGETAHVKLAFVSSDRIASFEGEADVEPTVPAANGTFGLEKFSLALLSPYYRDVLAVDVQKGSLDLAGRFALGAGGNLTISEGVASIADLRLAFPGQRQPLWRFPSLVVGGVDVDLDGRKVTIGEFQSANAVLRLAREKDGSLEVARLLKTTETTGAAPDDGTWTLALEKLRIGGASIDVEDRVPQPAVKLALRDLTLEATGLSNARGAKASMSLRARVGARGRVSFSGPVTNNPVSAAGRLDISALDLVALRAYVESNVNVVLTAGTLSAKGRVAFDVPQRGPVKATWKGDVTVADFAALDKPTASDLARWKSLTIAGADIASEPFRVAIERIGAEDYFARVIVYQDGTLNLTRLLTPGAEPEPAPDAKPAAPPADGAAAREAQPVSIGKIELARGNVNFSDFFVRPNYTVNLTDVAGSVSAMSADLAGDVAFTARVDSTAPVEVAGRVNPFARELALDLTAKARDVDLPALTTYSVKYAGYGIERGKLAFDVHYRIENRKLTAENRLVLDQLTFGAQRVDSPTATTLPVLLAVALLKDSRGVIDIHLPISGSLDDPQFSIGGLIVRVIVNLITKAVTAPFALLAAVFGGGEELSTVPFAPGSAALGAEAQKRLDTLGKALADRPGLRLDIGGRADPAGDREALRRASVESAMKRARMRSLVSEGNAPASVDLVTIGADERVRWLTAAYRESSIKDRPRNVFGLLKDVPPAEMEAMLLADARVDDDALRALANARAQSVKGALAAKGIAGERLFVVAPRLGGDGAAPAAGGGPAGDGAPAPAAPTSPARVDLALR
ncbi:hypothetical protein BURK1_01149 [Burkholderiales bacterium]|nr:hypothetical protein BURK1_01149 [Burkholderiales bacterium]